MFQASSLIGACSSKSTHSVMERGQCREEEPTTSDIKLVLAPRTGQRIMSPVWAPGL